MVVPEHVEKPCVRMQGSDRHIRKQIGSKGFPDKVIAADPRSILQDAMQDVAEHTFISFIFWKNVPFCSTKVNYLASLGVFAIKVGSVQDTPLWRRHSNGNKLSHKEYYDLLLDYIPHYYEDHVKMYVLLGGGVSLNEREHYYHVCAEKYDKGDEIAVQKYLCSAARFHAYISPDGRFLPCMAITSIEKQKDFPLISEHGVKKCMHDSYYMNFVGARVEELLKRNEKCGSCEYKYKCCGGCRAIAMCENDGELYSPDPESCFLFENRYIEKFHQAADEAIKKYRQND